VTHKYSIILFTLHTRDGKIAKILTR